MRERIYHNGTTSTTEEESIERAGRSTVIVFFIRRARCVVVVQLAVFPLALLASLAVQFEFLNNVGI
jgi:hypothetical protein